MILQRLFINSITHKTNTGIDYLYGLHVTETVKTSHAEDTSTWCACLFFRDDNIIAVKSEH